MASPFSGMGFDPTQALLNSPAMARYQNMYRAVMMGRNPQLAVQQMVGGNPQLRALLQQGRNPEQLFREMAKQRGIDPDAFMASLRGSR